jgi:hypothetical protein
MHEVIAFLHVPSKVGNICMHGGGGLLGFRNKPNLATAQRAIKNPVIFWRLAGT